jgi:hypothetical protein
MSAAGHWRGTLGIVEVSQSDLTHPSKPRIETRVLTLALYSQFVRFQNHREAFDKLYFDALASENLLFMSDCAAFLELLSRVERIGLKVVCAPLPARPWVDSRKAVLVHGAVP